jgi:hypothetical protein
MEEKYPDAYVVAGENFCFRDFACAKTETIKGLHSIIVLSMQCLEIVLRHGHIRRTYDRDSLIQDNDPYVEGLLNSIRKGNTLKE